MELVKLVLDPKGASLPLHDANANKSAWATYGLATLAAVNVLGIALLWAIAGCVALLFIASDPKSHPGRLLRTTGLIHGAIALLTLPGYAAMLLYVHANGRMTEGLDWIPPPTVARLVSDTADVYLMQISSPITFRHFAGAVPAMSAIVAGFAILGLVSMRRNPRVLAVLISAILVLPLALLAISLVQPVWLPRYLLWGAVPFFIVAGLGIALFRARAQFAVAVAVGALSLVNLFPYYAIEAKPRWDLAAAALKPAAEEDDLVLVADPWVPHLMNAYLTRAGLRLPDSQWTTDVGAALRRIRGGGRVWAVFGRVGQVDHEDLGHFRQRISSLGSPTAEREVGLDIVVLLFDSRSSRAAGVDASD